MPYFDHNATTPLTPVAREVWLKAADENWHNPSSPYRDAARARIRLDNARSQLAEFLGTQPESLVFTSGATEAADAVMRHLAHAAEPGQAIAVNPTEHPALLEAARAAFGDRIVWLTLDRHGAVSTVALRELLVSSRVVAVVTMAANNETGVLQPWHDCVDLCRASRVPLVCDASQWLGKLPASGLANADWVVGAGHKFGGPKGVGFVKIPDHANGFLVQPGGGQEGGHRGGTENVPAIWAMVAALAHAEQKQVFMEADRLIWRGEFERQLELRLPGVRIVARDAERLWNTVCLVMPAGENSRWVLKLDKLGYQVSTGAACATGKGGPSHVLAALGFTAEEMRRVLRISSGWETRREDWENLLAAILGVARELGSLDTAV